MRQALAIFAKVPRPGRVKTRLTRELSTDDAAALHAAFVADIWLRNQDRPGQELFLYADRCWPAWEELTGPERFRLQAPGDLGDRMFACLAELASEGFERTLLIGSDSPDLPLDYLAAGFDRLADEADAVLGPTFDGGYYAVGCRRPRGGMFDGVPWSTPETLERTNRRFESCGYRVRLLEPWYDVDSPADLRRLAASDGLGQHTRRWLQTRAAPAWGALA